jgi:hypothetical protein
MSQDINKNEHSFKALPGLYIVTGQCNVTEIKNMMCVELNRKAYPALP